MLTHYINAAMHHATYEIVEDGTYFGEIPGFQEVWAHTASLESCRNELRDVLEEWIVLSLRSDCTFPDIDGNNLTIERPDSLAAKAEAYEARVALEVARLESQVSSLAS
jgi:predicted RNase H-like HicB family nuclease